MGRLSSSRHLPRHDARARRARCWCSPSSCCGTSASRRPAPRGWGTARVDPAVAVEQRVQGQLVEHDHHHGGRVCRPRRRRGFVRPQEAGGGRRGQEQEQEAEGSQGREGQPEVHSGKPSRRRPPAPTPSRIAPTTSGMPLPSGRAACMTNTATNTTRNTRCTQAAGPLAEHEAHGHLHEPQAQRGQERDGQPEQHDLRRRGPPEGELLDPSTEDVQQRLRQRKATQARTARRRRGTGRARFGPRQRSAFPVRPSDQASTPWTSPSPPGSGAPRRSSSTGP